MSLPVRGAWIEIVNVIGNSGGWLRRSPCGERGLKFQELSVYLPLLLSLPVRGAWIEMLFMPMRIRKHNIVAPRAGSVD